MEGFDVRKLLATFFAKQLSPKIFGPDPQSFSEILFDAVLATKSDYNHYRIYTASITDFEDGSDLIGIIKVYYICSVFNSFLLLVSIIICFQILYERICVKYGESMCSI